jgi:hypothetical protein
MADLFRIGPTERIVLAPGILIGLQILFRSLGVRRLHLTDQEYYTQAHFPELKVGTLGIDHYLAPRRPPRPDALVVSLVTFRGEALPIAGVFRRVRAVYGRRHPLLVAGAAGFPSLADLGADIICGDAGKWILPAEWESKIAFFWFRTAALASAAGRAFAPFFLATHGQDELPHARWLDPAEVLAVARWFKKRPPARAALLRRHRASLSLAARLADHYGVPRPSNICALRLDAATPEDALLKKLGRRHLVWRMPGGDIRILCRADACRGI